MNEHRTPEEQQALDAQYMALALEEARAAGAAGEVPIGAVVVYEPIDRGTRRPLAGLMHQARIARCVYGAPDQKAGAVGTLYDIHADGRLNHQFEVTGGVREEECVALLRGFFRARRKKPMSNLG